MHRRVSRSVAILVILLMLAAGGADARKADWTFGDARYFTIDSICRDGAVLSAVWNPPGTSSGSTIDIGARLYTSTSTPLPNPFSGITRRPSAAYGPMLATTQVFSMPLHVDPFPADINNDDVIQDPQEYFDVYMLGEQLHWSQQLPVGALVVITHSGVGYNWEYVEDCYLDSFVVDGGSETTIDNTKLQADFDVMPPAETLYRLTNPPAYGTLRLSGSPLGANGTFTQDDVDNNLLSYDQDGGLAVSDVFTFSLAGTTRVSIRTNGAQATGGGSYDPVISGGASQVVFQSYATNLVSGDTNTCSSFTTPGECPDIFMRDLSDGTTTRASVSYAGAQANNASYTPALSSDGTTVAFSSLATNLVNATDDCLVFAGDPDGARDIFWRPTFSNNPVRRFSVGPERFAKCYQGDANSYAPALSKDGVYAAFESDATNLMQYRDNSNVLQGTPDTNGFRDIYYHYSTETQLVSRASGFSGAFANNNSYAPSMSGDGRFVTFYSPATNLAADGNGTEADIFVRDTHPPYSTTLISRATNGVQGNGPSYSPSMSADGRYVAFYSFATNLVSGDTNTCGAYTTPGECPDIFVRDRDADEDGIFDETGAVSTTRVSLATGGAQPNGASYTPAISTHGRYVAFYSYATNLVAGDTNTCGSFTTPGECPDIFVYDRDTGQTVRVSVASDGSQSNGASYDPSISADGEYVAFESDATNLIDLDTNGELDIFVHYTGFSSGFPIVINVQSVYLPVVISNGP